MGGAAVHPTDQALQTYGPGKLDDARPHRSTNTWSLARNARAGWPRWGDGKFKTRRFEVRRGDKNEALVVEYEPTRESPGRESGSASTKAQLIPTKETKADTRVPSDGFEPLLNGNDLSGWTVSLGSNTDWNVEDGSIRLAGTSGASTIASARSDYEDFHLRRVCAL
jgi:hypothetical protein